MRLTFKQLEYFVATADTGSIKHAAQKISISAPSISSAITQLESEFGVQLFVRQHAQGLTLTSTGQRFAQRNWRQFECGLYGNTCPDDSTASHQVV